MAKHIPDVAFRVPNNRTGRRFIELARLYVNRERFGTICTRPRGNRPSHGSHDSIREGCKSFGVYLRDSKAEAEGKRKWLTDYVDYFVNERSVKLNALHDAALVKQYDEIWSMRHESNKSFIERWKFDDIFTSRRILIKRLHRWQISSIVVWIGGLALGIMIGSR